MAELADDFVAQVPREDDDEIGLLDVDPVGGDDRDVAAREKAALLVRAGIRDEANQLIALDPAIVEQGIALGRRAVAGDRLAGRALVAQEFQEIDADALDPRLEAFVDGALAEPRAI